MVVFWCELLENTLENIQFLFLLKALGEMDIQNSYLWANMSQVVMWTLDAFLYLQGWANF